MSKQVKEMQMGVMKNAFEKVRDFVVLNAGGVPAVSENQLRLTLRKQQVSLMMVKNSLARRVFGELGMKFDKVWEGPTVLAWGKDSIAELSKTLDEHLKKDPFKEKLKVRTAIADGTPVTFEVAKTMPTRGELLSEILGLLLSPARQVAAQIAGPACQVAGQLQTLSEKKPDEAAPAAG
jgi:large subunit ribosomal protein L10